MSIEDDHEHLAEQMRKAMASVPPGYPGHELPSEESQREMNAMIVRSYLSAAEDFRFLAAHVEEDRFFRLAIHDLSALGYSIGPMPMTGYTGPIGYHR
jgi:hypothetical protein